MNSITKFAVCAAVFAGAAVVSAETLDFTKPGQFLNPMRKSVTEANGQIKTQGKTFLISKKVFTLDPVPAGAVSDVFLDRQPVRGQCQQSELFPGGGAVPGGTGQSLRCQ